MRYPRISDTPDKFDEFGNKLCRNCTNLVSKTRRHYCSKKCMAEFNRNNDWYWVRKYVLRRDKFKCSICNKRYKKSLLDVDHIIPVQMIKDKEEVRYTHNPFDKNNLRLLCKECHKAKTKLDRETIKEIKSQL